MSRFVLLDVLRTAAIVLMVLYHLLFNLAFFWRRIDPVTGFPWTIMIVATASLFLFVAGMSFWIVRGKPLRRHIRRSAIVLTAAGGVTVVTLLLMPVAYIRFGILHLIGTGLLVLTCFARVRGTALAGAAGAIIIAIAPYVTSLPVRHPLLLPLGITYPGFLSLDYYPLFPWLGVLLLGYASTPLVLRIAPWTYETHNRISPFLFPGRHALAIYLVHQPILFAILTLLLGRPSL